MMHPCTGTAYTHCTRGKEPTSTKRSEFLKRHKASLDSVLLHTALIARRPCIMESNLDLIE
jgi:hypothetical protein